MAAPLDAFLASALATLAHAAAAGRAAPASADALLHAALCPLAAALAARAASGAPSPPAAVHSRARGVARNLLRAVALGSADHAALAVTALALAASATGAVVDVVVRALAAAAARVAGGAGGDSVAAGGDTTDDGDVADGDGGGDGDGAASLAVAADAAADASLPGALSSALVSAINALSGPAQADAPAALGVPCSEGLVRAAALDFATALLTIAREAVFTSDRRVLREIAARALADAGDGASRDAWALLIGELA